MKFLHIVMLFLNLGVVFSQEFKPLDTISYEQRMSLKKDYEEHFKVYNKTISQKYTGKLRKGVVALVEERQEEILKTFIEDDLLFNNSFLEFLETSLDSVKIKNPEITEDYSVLLSKSPSPNAFSIGYNTIIVNIGLFKYLKNEHHLRSVLLHELAHELMAHSTNNIIEEAEASLSSKTKSEIEDLSRNKYNKGGLAFKKLKEILMNKSQKSRDQELEADSLGFIMFSKTGWPKQTFINALNQIKQFEEAPNYVLDSTIYKRLFDLEGQPFKNDWLKKEDFSAYNYDHFKEKINADSIASHPELDSRIEKLKSYLPEGMNYTFLEPSEEFKALKEKALFQQVANLYNMKEYGASLYSCLILLELYSDMSYLLKYIGLNFTKIYEAQKEYKLNRYVEQLNPNEQSESYNLFLNFIWNLRLKEMKTIANHYTSTYPNN